MSTALGFAKESYLRKKARLNHGPVIEQAPQQIPIGVPPATEVILGAAVQVAEVEVRILCLLPSRVSICITNLHAPQMDSTPVEVVDPPHAETSEGL